MNIEQQVFKKDPHSFYEPGQPKVTKLKWDIIGLDIEANILHGVATWDFNKSGQTNFDTRALNILTIKNSSGELIPYEVGKAEKVRGQCLSFVVPDDQKVIIAYHTSPNASGLQWMDPSLAGGHPFIYTQGEAINARSYIPCQDTPSIKFPFQGSIRVPRNLRGLMAASEHVGRLGPDIDGHCTEFWSMPFPIPSYLLAFAVGDLVSRDISERSRVWALPSVIDAAFNEFKDFEVLIKAGESIFGEYPFGRADILVMLPSFPYGGMENPCLMYVTPALLTGDGSGMVVIAHELAHAWTGNLVTNAFWDAFWLNEGPTVWGEGRIMEAVYGLDRAMLGRLLFKQEFIHDCARCKAANEWHLTKLATEADDVDPDDIFSRIPYFKGSQLWRLLEQTAGRERFDAFVISYLDTFKYGSIDNEMFVDSVTQHLGREIVDKVRIHQWIYESGVPDNDPAIESSLIGPVEELAMRSEAPARGTPWTTEQFQLYLELLPRPVSQDLIGGLDFDFKERIQPYVEVNFSFLTAAVEAQYFEVLPRVEAFLRSYGRTKYLKPIYEALVKTESGKAFANRVFSEARKGYHPVAIAMVEKVFAKAA